MSHILKTGKSKIKVQVNSVPGEDSPPGLQMAAFSLAVFSHGRELFGVSSNKSTDPIIWVPLS